MATGTIISSKMDKCPSCFRTLCKRTEQDLIDYRHRGCSVLAKSAIIKCLGCKKHYIVSGTEGIIEETRV
jgi:hypothetical protein